MKKSFNTHLIMIGLSSVIALTACERRERAPSKAKSNTLNTNTNPTPAASPVASPVASPIPSPVTSPVASPVPSPVVSPAAPLTAEQFAGMKDVLVKAAEAMKTEKYEILISQGAAAETIVEFSKPALTALRESLIAVTGSTVDKAEQKMNCDLSKFGELHASAVSSIESRGVNGIEEAIVASELELSKAIVLAVEGARHHLGITELTCGPAPSPSPSADAE